ncbi:MAG: polysaccharide deacetylase [Acidobacteria bacterium]|nr:polysaccharide deacetylase [Acidobacteriota bacterium]
MKPLVVGGLRRLAAACARAVVRLSGRRCGLVLVFHATGHVTGDPAERVNPEIGQKLLHRQFGHLKRAYRVVPAAELQACAITRRRGAKVPVAITFDDDLRSHVDTALPLLRRYDLPATFFLCGASLEAPNEFWWERLQRAHERHAVPPALRQMSLAQAADHLVRMQPAERETLDRELAVCAGAPAPDTGLRANDVRALAELGFEIGWHTRRHERLAGAPPATLEALIGEGREDLELAAGVRMEAIAYPFGLADEATLAAAAAAGFSRGYTNAEHQVTNSSLPLALGRIEPRPDPGPGRFELQMARSILRRNQS